MSSCDILLLFGFGLYLAIVVTSASEVDAVFKDILKIVHINGGINVRL